METGQDRPDCLRLQCAGNNHGVPVAQHGILYYFHQEQTMAVSHHYDVIIEWTGNRGVGTLDYKSYDRDHVIRANDKPDIAGSSDAAFAGDA